MHAQRDAQRAEALIGQVGQVGQAVVSQEEARRADVVVRLAGAYTNPPTRARAAAAAVSEQHIDVGGVEKARSRQHRDAGYLEAVDEEDGWRVGRGDGQPAR